jgi:hypothetical protein
MKRRRQILAKEILDHREKHNLVAFLCELVKTSAKTPILDAPRGPVRTALKAIERAKLRWFKKGWIAALKQ